HAWSGEPSRADARPGDKPAREDCVLSRRHRTKTSAGGLLHALGLQHRAQPPFGFGIVALGKAKTFGRLLGQHEFPHNDLKVALLLVPVADISAVETDSEGPLRAR